MLYLDIPVTINYLIGFSTCVMNIKFEQRKLKKIGT